MNRRHWITSALAAFPLAICSNSIAAEQTSSARYTMDLCPGRIGVDVDQNAAIDLAAAHGFQSVEPFGTHLTSLSPTQLSDLLGRLKERKLVWGAASLEMNFRADIAEFERGLKDLPAAAQGLQRAGVTRVGTWISPAHSTLTYLANFQLHATRLRQISKIFQDHAIRFGLEYVGPKKSWTSKRFAFIHTLAETQELISEINVGNLGVVLDSWHWYCAEESVEDLRALNQQQIVAVDLNDAPAGIARDQQIDNRRELPAATGVIDVRSFLDVLKTLGYDGPIRAEPFNQPLNALDNQAAVQATAIAMKKALGLS